VNSETRTRRKERTISIMKILKKNWD